jgi:hypothetical protein
MKIVLLRLRGAKRVTKRDVRPSKEALPTREMEKKSITSATIAPEVWIVSGLLLSLVQQIVGVSLRQRLEEKPEVDVSETNKE